MKYAVKTTKIRCYIIYIIILISFFILTTRLLLIWNNINLEKRRHELSIDKEYNIEPKEKISIYDRNGLIISGNLPTYSLYLKPYKITNSQQISAELSKYFPDFDQKLLNSNIKNKKTFMQIKKHITPKDKLKLLDAGVPFLHFQDNFKRVYPHKNLFSHVLGFVDIDNNGLTGLEFFLDKNMEKVKPYIKNNNLTLSLDLYIQHIIRKILQKHSINYDTIGSAAILLNIKNGEILSIVSLPDFDPNNPLDYPRENLFNRTTLGLYEMGSIFKLITLSSALNENLVSTENTFDTSRKLEIGKFTIKDYVNNTGLLTLEDTIVKSSNKGIAQINEILGINNQKKYIQKFRILEPLSIEIPEKSNSIIPKKWSKASSTTISYGYGIATSLLHLTQSIAAIINNGYFISPTIIKDRHLIHEQIISKETSEKIKEIMIETVKRGTARSAKIKNYEFGAKTGTAEKNINGIYDRNKNIATFIAFFPAENPQFILSIMLDEPKINNKSVTGGRSAAIVGKEIIENLKDIIE